MTMPCCGSHARAIRPISSGHARCWKPSPTWPPAHRKRSTRWQPNVTTAARALGLSERSLERLLLGGTGRTPVYWKRLARLRRVARALSPEVPLAELAVDHGFADQAHMTREFRRWLGTTPTRVQACASWRLLLAQSGYGDPVIGVQSSTRNPSRSDT